jgi:hypothetical protein
MKHLVSFLLLACALLAQTELSNVTIRTPGTPPFKGSVVFSPDNYDIVWGPDRRLSVVPKGSLPAQAGNAGRVLGTDGTNLSWVLSGGGGGSLGDLQVARSSATVAGAAAGKIRFAGVVCDLPAATATITAGSGSGAVEWYVSPTCTVVVEHATAAGLTVSCTNCTASQVSTPTVPMGSYRLANTSAVSGAWSTTITDRRAVLSDPSVVNGPGLTRDFINGQTVLGVEFTDVPRLGGTSVFTGSVDLSPATSFGVPRGVGAPSSGCTTSDHIGRVRQNQSALGRIYRCSPTATGVSWVPENGNTIRLTNPVYGAGVGASGVITGIPAASAAATEFPNAGGQVDWYLMVPEGMTAASVTIRFQFAQDDGVAGAVGWTLTVGCFAAGTGTGTGFVSGTPVSVSLTPQAGFRFLQGSSALAVITASPATPCAAGGVMSVRLARSDSDAQTRPSYAILPEVILWQ